MSNAAQPAVRLSAVEKRFGSLVAVHPLHLEIPPGGFFSIIGPSGCGKTTTLRMIAGLEHPDAGTIEVGGRNVTRMPAHRRPVNTVFQSYALFPHLDVQANIAFGLVEEHRPRAEIRQRVAEMIDLVHLEGRERSKPRQLSGGQQQRVALARALVKHPQVLLLDEPLGALDFKLRKELQVQLKEVQRRVGITFVYVTHDQEEAFAMSDAVAVMNQGVLEQVGQPEDVYRRPKTPFVATFVGQANRFAGAVARRDGERRYRVALETGVEVAAGGPAGLDPGVAVQVILRPEELALDAAGQYPATVTDVSYVGPVRQVTVEADRLGTVLLTLPGHAPVEPGAGVRLSWPDSAAWIVPAEADVGQTPSRGIANDHAPE
ncbi:MAG TPA: ABC transporter ATP-binding protein [Gaiellales bacterium]|nr:ABC transporter ATP-binding protein [Gaiellales bacterium]